MEVAAYLERQAEHHGYDSQTTPSVFTKTYDLAEHEERLFVTDHAVTCLRYHVVLATQWRRAARSIFNRVGIGSCGLLASDAARDKGCDSESLVFGRSCSFGANDPSNRFSSTGCDRLDECGTEFDVKAI
ncbi:MAG: hypothetical protein Q8M16_05750 [Pirellulaceae bacterium]|nr:hypothetical protein [Pirellulaceae bacterium]